MWRWVEPGETRSQRRSDWFASQGAAIRNAIYNACLKHPDDQAQQDQLWSSLKGAGWTLERRQD